MTRIFEVTVVKQVELDDVIGLIKLLDKATDEVVLNNTGKFISASAKEIYIEEIK